VLSYVMVDGFTEAGRAAAMADLKKAIAEADGVITDFALFDGKANAIQLTVELDGAALVLFRDALGRVAVRLFDRCMASLDVAQRLLAPAKPVKALLHVAFGVPRI
jgi:hypothetical protein